MNKLFRWLFAMASTSLLRLFVAPTSLWQKIVTSCQSWAKSCMESCLTALTNLFSTISLRLRSLWQSEQQSNPQ